MEQTQECVSKTVGFPKQHNAQECFVLRREQQSVFRKSYNGGFIMDGCGLISITLDEVNLSSVNNL